MDDSSHFQFSLNENRIFYSNLTTITTILLLAVPRQKVLEWCLDNSFELVELDPVEYSDDDEMEGQTKNL